ncbi:MAG: histidine phosphotransferase family protein [Candidatus Tisiphia sp.]
MELEIQNDNFIGIKIVVTSPNLRLDQDRADILLGNRTIDDVSIENVHEYYTYYLITEYGYKLAITPSTDSVEYILVGNLY